MTRPMKKKHCIDNTTGATERCSRVFLLASVVGGRMAARQRPARQPNPKTTEQWPPPVDTGKKKAKNAPSSFFPPSACQTFFLQRDRNRRASISLLRQLRWTQLHERAQRPDSAKKERGKEKETEKGGSRSAARPAQPSSP
nr:hypothetical protein [Pandoravirus massiliensis]